VPGKYPATLNEGRLFPVRAVNDLLEITLPVTSERLNVYGSFIKALNFTVTISVAGLGYTEAGSFMAILSIPDVQVIVTYFELAADVPQAVTDCTLIFPLVESKCTRMVLPVAEPWIAAPGGIDHK
jgi:hypothetical protein